MDKRGTPMIHSTIRMLIPSKKQGEVMEILGSLAERYRFEPGCISCRVYRDAEVKHAIMFEELWRDEESLQRHLRSDEYRSLLLVVEMGLESPEIRFNTVSYSAGVEIIEEARSFTPRGRRHDRESNEYETANKKSMERRSSYEVQEKNALDDRSHPG